MAKRFRFRAIPFIATVLVAALGISLGNWQQRRAAEKLAVQAQLEVRGRAAPLPIGAAPVPAESVQYRPVKVTGHFLKDWPLYLENRPLNGQVGSYVLMPLRIGNSDMHVLVARGWVPRNNLERTKVPDFATPAGEVTVTGVARESIGRVMQLGDPPAIAPRAMVQNVTVAEFAKASGLALQPFFLAQTVPAAPDDTLARDWPAAALGADRNQGYAVQWYGLSLMAVLFFVFTGFKSAKQRASKE
jgi:cytochrome oxidase assembly protein ShyY1